jgi:myo-inositol-1(or 4)-monophosphatase
MDNTKFYLQLQKDAEEFAKKAMEILVSMQGKETLAVQKDEMDISTTADVAAEKCIIDLIKQKYPNHSISSEEIGEIKGSEPYRWIIDPLDETKEYIRGIKEFNCLIGVEENTQIIAGVSNCYGTGEVYQASKGNGAWCNGHKIHVSPQSSLIDSFIGFALPNRKLPSEEIAFGLNILTYLVHHTYRARGFWDHAKSLSWLSRGALDGVVLPSHLYKWPDIASAIILVEEAGGNVTDWNGNNVTEETSKNGVVASNGILHEELLNIVQ